MKSVFKADQVKWKRKRRIDNNKKARPKGRALIQITSDEESEIKPVAHYNHQH